MTLDTQLVDPWTAARARWTPPVPFGAIALWIAAAVPFTAALFPHRVVWFSVAIAFSLALCGVAVALGRTDRVGHVLLWVALMTLLLMTFWAGAVGPRDQMFAAVLVLGSVGVGVVRRNETTRQG